MMEGVALYTAIYSIPAVLLLIGMFMRFGGNRAGTKIAIPALIVLVVLVCAREMSDDPYVDTDLEAVAIAQTDRNSERHVTVIYEDGSVISLAADNIEYAQGSGKPVQTASIRKIHLFGWQIGSFPVKSLRVFVECPAHVEKYEDGSISGMATVFDEEPAEPTEQESKEKGTPDKAEFPERGL